MLITGGSGFIGSNLVRAALASGWKVVAPCRTAELPWRLKDLCRDRLSVRFDWNMRSSNDVFTLLNEVQPDVVVNAAAHGSHASDRDVGGLFATNVAATATLAEACTTTDVDQLILLGSVLEYQPSTEPLSESTALAPETLYGLTKSLSAKIGDFYKNQRNLCVTELRLFNIFGPWDDVRKLVPYVITQAITGEDIHLTSGDQRRDFVFVEDVTRILMAVATGRIPHGQTYNVCSGQPIAVADIAQRIVELSVSSSALTCGTVTERGDQRSVVTGTTKLRDYGLEPSHSLDEGLRTTIRWYQDQRSTTGAAS